jgi:F-type H+-transporting ATPase subunit a
MLLALEFPPIDEVLEWPALFGEGTLLEFNKIALLNLIAVAITLAIFFLAARKRQLVPSGVQNVAESSVELIEDQIVMQTIGPEGLKFTPLFIAMFFFIFIGNIWEVLPSIQMPVNARMANPLFLALLSYVLFIVVGIQSQGFGGYFKNTLFPPGVPKALYLLVTPIEFISVFLVRPFSLAVRLFANMLAGHLLLVTFAVLTAATAIAAPIVVIAPFSFAMLVFLTLFEVLVSVLQAYIFTILTAVYIGFSMHPEH